MQSAISVGSAILGAFLGRKMLSTSTLNRAGTAARGASRAMREGADVTQAKESVASLESEQARLEEAFASESAALIGSLAEPDIKTLAVKPKRGGVTVEIFGLGWV